MAIIRTQFKILFVLSYLIGSTHRVTARLNFPLVVFGPIGSNEIKSNVDFDRDTNDFDINTSERTAIIENIHIESNVTKRVETTTINIFESLPIVDAHTVEMRNALPVFNYSSNSSDRSSKESLKVTYKPNDISSQTKKSRFDMSGKFITTYSVDKNMLVNKVGEKITSFESNVEYRKIVEYMLEYPLGFMLESMIFVLFIIPLIILTEIKNGLVMIMEGPVGIDSYENTDYVGPFMLDHTTERLENILEKLNVDEHSEKLSNLNRNVGIDIPSNRMATSFDDSEDTLDNADEQSDKIGNMFENRKILRTQKQERSTLPMKLQKIFRWNARGSISVSRSLSDSLLDLFEYYFGDVPGLGAPFILWDFFFREVLQGA